MKDSAPAPTARAKAEKLGRRDVFARKNPLDQPPKNTIKRRGYFAGEEIADAQRWHLEPDEVKAFFRAIPVDTFWYTYFLIQYTYGCRLSEPALVLNEDISFKKKMIVIKRLKKSSEDGGYRECAYPADDRMLVCLKGVLAMKFAEGVAKNPYLFPSPRPIDGEPGAERLSQLRNLDGFQAVSRFAAHRHFQEFAEAAKLPAHLAFSRSLRHARPVIMLASGDTPEHVQHLLGHSTLKMTMRYAATAEAMRRRLGKRDLDQGLRL